MRQGCVTGTLRGDDSTGVFQFNKGEYELYKLPVSGEIFAKSKMGTEAFYRADEPGYTILHHRAATRGSVVYENCHPFEHNYDEEGKFVVGVHNGTLTQSWQRHEDMTFDVDSDYLYYRIYSEGAAKALGDIKGSYALVWMEDDSKLRIAVNGERSLYFAFVKNKNVMLIASEAGMLWWLATRNGIEIEQIVAPVKDKVHTFTLSDLRKYDTEDIEKKETVFQSSRRSSDWTGQTAYPATSYGYNVHSPIEERLKPYKLSIGQLVNFYMDCDCALPHNKIEGYVDVGDGTDFVKACIYAPTEEAAEAMNEAKEGFVEVPVRSITSVVVRDKTGLTDDKEDVIICGTPTITVAAQDDELPDVDMVDGPNGKKLTIVEFFKKTSNGCMQCGQSIPIKDAKNLAWVNGDMDALCTACSDNWKERSA